MHRRFAEVKIDPLQPAIVSTISTPLRAADGFGRLGLLSQRVLGKLAVGRVSKVRNTYSLFCESSRFSSKGRTPVSRILSNYLSEASSQARMVRRSGPITPGARRRYRSRRLPAQGPHRRLPAATWPGITGLGPASVTDRLIGKGVRQTGRGWALPGPAR